MVSTKNNIDCNKLLYMQNYIFTYIPVNRRVFEKYHVQMFIHSVIAISEFKYFIILFSLRVYSVISSS